METTNMKMKKAAQKQELICINCPRGCLLTAARNGEDLVIQGNACDRGPAYARQELVNPMRVLTVLMRPADGSAPVSVRTDRPVPKDMLFACAAEIYRTHPETPVRRGDILIRDLCGTGSNVVATRDSQDL